MGSSRWNKYLANFRLQKKAIRLIENISKNGSTIKSFGTLKILRLPDIHTFSIMIFMFKYKNGLLPSIFNNYFIENSSFHRYPTRKSKQLRIPKVKTKLANSFIKTTGVDKWNDITAEMELLPGTSLNVLKKRLLNLLVLKYLEN